MKKSVLVTGGAGFIGSHTADLLGKEGYEVILFDSLQQYKGKWPDYVKNKKFKLIKGDVTIKKDLEKAVTGVDYIIYLAAHQDQLSNFSRFYDINTKGISLLYEIIYERNLSIKKILYASSQFVYGDGIYKDSRGKNFMPDLRNIKQFKENKFEILDSFGKKAKFIPFKENQEVNPTNSYGLSKVASEKFILRVGKTMGIPSVITRYSIVQGPRQSPENIYSGALRIFTMQALAGEPITVYEDGMQLRDFVNIEDVVKANVLLLGNKDVAFEVYNIGGGLGYSILDFAKIVKETSRSKSKIEIGNFRKTDTRNAISNISKIKSLGWKPLHGPEKSIKDYIDWIKEINYNIKSIKEANKKLREAGVIG